MLHTLAKRALPSVKRDCIFVKRALFLVEKEGVREKERERERDGDKQREKERARERGRVCV